MKKFDEISINELCVNISDGNYSSKYPRQSDFLDYGVPFIRSINFKNNTLVKKNLRYISEEKHSELKKGHLKTNDILITTRGEIGKVAIVPEAFNDANINAQIVRLELNKNLILPKFLLFSFKSNIMQSRLFKSSTGTALKQLSVSNLKKINVPVIPLNQQNKIVDILEKAEKLKEKRKQANKLADEYLKSLFLRMFGNVLLNSKKCDTCKIKDGILDVKNVDPKSKFGKKEFYYVDIASINRKIKQITGPVKINGINAPSRARQEIFSKDLLISTVRPNLNSVAMVSKKYNGQICSTGFSVLRADDRIFASEYLFYISQMNYFIDKLVSSCSGANYPSVSDKFLKNIEISRPSIGIQNKFAEEVKKIEKIKENQKESEKELDNLFNSLMQKAFKGELIA